MASLTFTVLAAMSASSALATPASLIVTAPEDTEKLSVENEATPLFEELASSAAIVTVVPVAEVSTPSPPVIVRVSESRSMSIEPLSVAISKSSAVSCVSTYALIDCWVANLTAESDAMSSSSLIPVTVAPSPATLTLLNLPVEVVVAPMGVPSIEPALMSTELDVSGSTARVIHASLAWFRIFRRLFVVSSQTNPIALAAWPEALVSTVGAVALATITCAAWSGPSLSVPAGKVCLRTFLIS